VPVSAFRTLLKAKITQYGQGKEAKGKKNEGVN